MAEERLNIVFFGAGAFGLPTLEALHEQHNVLAVVSQPDRPAGRGRQATPTPIAAWAQEHLARAQLMRPDNVNAPSVVDEIQRLPIGPPSRRAGAFVVIAFGQKLGEPLLEQRFAINLHASLLPRWRGAAPIHHAIRAGDVKTGNSVITLAQQMDAGLILGQSYRAIERGAHPVTTGELHDLLAQDGPQLVLDVLAQYAGDALDAAPQDEAVATRAPKLSKGAGQLDFAQPAARVADMINGLSPWPGVSAQLDGATLRLLRAAVEPAPSEATPQASGAILDVASGTIRCGGGSAIRLLEVQPAGRKALAWRDFANGAHLDPTADNRLRPMQTMMGA